MTVTVNNILQQVQTYQMAGMAFLDNLFALYSLSNKKFMNFQDSAPGNLGQTVTFELPPRQTSRSSLVWDPQIIQQRVQNLTVDKQWSIAVNYTTQQFVYNVKDYMQRVGEGILEELGSNVEEWLALNIVSGTPVYATSTPYAPTGALHTESGPYRYFNSPNTPVNSYQQLASFLTYFRNYGAAQNVKAIISDIAYPSIVGTGLNQFVTRRNEEIAMSWELGRFSNCDFYQSNMLPLHVSGNAGNNGTILTVVSTNDATGENITQITFSGATASDPNVVFSGDVGRFIDGVSGQPNLRYLKFVGHSISSNPVQVRATANSGADGSGNVTVNILAGSNNQGLCSQSGNPNQNILYNIVAGMQFKFEASHKAGLIYSGNALFLAMPTLPDQRPFDTANKRDPHTAAAWRMTYGSVLGQNQALLGYDGLTGSTLVPEYSARILFPLNQ